MGQVAINDAFINKGMILYTELKGNSTPEQACTTALEALQLGYLIDPQPLIHLDPNEHVEILQSLAHVIGKDRSWEPMYRGFPQEVIETSDVDLWYNAFAHYLTWGEWLPNAEQEFEREHLWQSVRNPWVLKFVKAEPDLLIKQWSRAVAISQADLKASLVIAELMGAETRAAFEATTFRNGENFAAAVMALGDFNAALTKIRNVDDLLRAIVVTYCHEPNRGRDLLAQRYINDVRFRPIPRAVRRQIVAELSRFDDPTSIDRIRKHQTMWRLVLRKVHPYSIKGHNKFVLDVIHGNVKYQSFNAQVELALDRRDVTKALELLAHNPGNLLRRINHLLQIVDSGHWSIWFRNQAQADALIAAIRAYGPKARLTTLISAFNAVRNRDALVKVTRLPHNGNVIRQVTPVSVSEKLVHQVLAALEAAIETKLAALPGPENPVPIEAPEPVELVRRDFSIGLTDLSRGQRLPLRGPILRLFVHWVGLDVDLGVVFANADLTQATGHLDYTNISKNPLKKWVLHSGDIVSAPDGAAEFIDIDLAGITQHRNIRYALASIISYSGLPFSRIDNLAGVMDREESMSGELFEPQTVETAMRCINNSTSAIPFAIDLKNRELIWLDTSLGTCLGGFAAGRSNIVACVRAELTSLSTRMTNGELLALWARAHQVDTVQSVNIEAKEIVADLLQESAE